MNNSKKWDNYWELWHSAKEDGTLNSVPGKLSCVSYAPNIGYTSWIFKYNGVYISVSDIGNRCYNVDYIVSLKDVVVAKIMSLKDVLHYQMSLKSSI